MNKYYSLILSLIIGVMVVILMGLFSECNDDGGGEGSVKPVSTVDELVNAVNACNNQPWDKCKYDSLSALVQMSQQHTEMIKQNLKATLDDYYLHSMKITFDQWKSSGCMDASVSVCKSSAGSNVASLIQSIQDGINEQPLSIFIPELENCITEYSEINQVNAVVRDVMAFIRGPYDQSRYDNLKSRIESLRSKQHVLNCHNNEQDLIETLSELKDFQDMVENYNALLRKNRGIRVIRSLISNNFDLSKYDHYDQLLQ